MTNREAAEIFQAEVDALLETGLVSEGNTKIRARRHAIKRLESAQGEAVLLADVLEAVQGNWVYGRDRLVKFINSLPRVLTMDEVGK